MRGAFLFVYFPARLFCGAHVNHRRISLDCIYAVDVIVYTVAKHLKHMTFNDTDKAATDKKMMEEKAKMEADKKAADKPTSV